jgi:molecular chaperone Hsp33
MSDQLIVATAGAGFIRALVATTTEMVSEAQRRHDTWPTASAALGRVLTAGALMGAMLKGEQRLTLRVLGDGPLGAIVVTADAEGHVRGYVQEPHVHLPANAVGKLDVSGAVGAGDLHVIKDLGLRDAYQGSVPLVSGEIGEDFAEYFSKSEQTPSAVALGVLVETDNTIKAAGGFIIQLLPGADDETASRLESQLKGLPSITQMIDRGFDAKQILEWALAPFDLNILETRPVQFHCSCNRDRLERVLISLGDQELAEMIEEQQGAELTCHFCRKVYHFSEAELGDLRQRLKHQQEEHGDDGEQE